MKILRKETIGELHFQHRVWLNELNFYKEDIKILKERLDEVAQKNTNKEAQIGVEQFQNKFFIQNNEIDNLMHAIRENEEKAIEQGMTHIRRADYEASNEYLELKDRMVQFEKLYKELKESFYDFLLKWM